MMITILGLLSIPISYYIYSQYRVQTALDKNARNVDRNANDFIDFTQGTQHVSPVNIKITSARGRQLIKNTESLSLSVYLDPVGKPTIGWGHLIRDDELFDVIDEVEADTILAFDLLDAENCIEAKVNSDLNQNQFDALVSFVFNVGCGNFTSSRMLRKLNAKDYGAAANEFKRWKFADGREFAGLVTRRRKERDLFLA